jgi:phenylacetic acid degradation operon negative regulatory protein
MIIFHPPRRSNVEETSLDIQVHSDTVVFTLFGQYVLPRCGEIWIGSLIQAMAPLGISAGAVRTVVSRMKHKGYLESQQAGRQSFYRLTDMGLNEVRWGGVRMRSAPDSQWDGQWTVVTYSIPEEHRARRGALRWMLHVWGFGALSPGVWVSPGSLPREAEKHCQEIDVWKYVEVFRADHVGPSHPHDVVARAWPQLEALGDLYQTYLARHAPVLRDFKAGQLDDAKCFTAHLECLCEFVAITLHDPDLPSRLLPANCPRPAAQLLFEEITQALKEPAGRYFDSIYKTMKGQIPQ